MKHRITVAVALILALAASGVTAQNINFLHRGPVAALSDADKETLRQTFRQALDSGKDGETIEWSNPDTEASGSISLIDTHQDYGTTCRTVRTLTTADGREGGGVYRLCLANDETWRFAPLRNDRD